MSSGQPEPIDHISVVIITRNAERHLGKCLRALKDFREVIVLDSGSTDSTLAIAATFPNVKTFHQPFAGFGRQKNAAIDLASNDWVFSLDADEVADETCINALRKTYAANQVGEIRRLNYYRSRPVEACGWQNDLIPRFFNRKHTRFLEKEIHEVVDTSNAERFRLPGTVHHYAYSNPDELLRKIEFYSALYARERRFRKKTSLPMIVLKTFFSFFRNYFLQRGVLYGYEGLLIAYSNASGVFYKYMKLHELNHSLRISLVITTYNRPDALALVIRSAFRQTMPPHEILIADDGSGPETARTIEALQQRSPVPLKHIWHEDTGFRLSEIRNKAIAAAEGEYIVMVDGDMVLQKNFIRSHARAARPGFFVQGSRVLLSEKLTKEKIANGSISFYALMGGITNRLNAINFPLLSGWVSKVKNTIVGVRGANMAFWKDDVVRINGFDNHFIDWGREDSEFCGRMLRNGIRRRNLKLGGVAYHLYHPESSRAKLNVNDQLLEDSEKENRLRCESGIDKFIVAQRSPA
jgi:glycosyltransferase involved in cell wall biosynthesis